MKKIITVLLLIAFCFSLCSCGTATVTAVHEQAVVEEVQAEAVPTPEPAPSKGDLLYEKYSGILDALEEEDFDGAINAITAMKPTPEARPVIEIALTQENFFDYFEFVEYPKIDWCVSVDKDSSGNIKCVYGQCGFYLKPEYTVSLEKLDDCSASIGIKYEMHLFEHNRGIKVDLEKQTYNVTGKARFNYKYDETVNGNPIWINNDDISFSFTFGEARLDNGKGDYGSWVTDNISLVSASGTIYLLND